MLLLLIQISEIGSQSSLFELSHSVPEFLCAVFEPGISLGLCFQLATESIGSQGDIACVFEMQ